MEIGNRDEIGKIIDKETTRKLKGARLLAMYAQCRVSSKNPRNVKILILVRREERKEYRFGELDDIYDQFLCPPFDFTGYSEFWRERELSLSFLFSLGGAHQAGKRNEVGEKETHKLCK